MDNLIFGNTIQNVKNHKDMKLETAAKRRSFLVSDQTITQQNSSQKIYWSLKWIKQK